MRVCQFHHSGGRQAVLYLNPVVKVNLDIRVCHLVSSEGVTVVSSKSGLSLSFSVNILWRPIVW